MRFNIRVYGILLDEERGILVSDEFIGGKEYVKFPGGGMEFGEGTRDCLRREFMEEMKLDVEVTDHIYTTDFYQESAFRKDDQLVSIYYYVKPLEEIDLSIIHFDNVTVPFEKDPHADQEAFRFISKNNFHPDLLSLPIDKIVAGMVKAHLSHPGPIGEKFR